MTIAPGTAESALSQIRKRLASAPEGDRLKEIGLGEIAIGPDALERLPALMAGLEAPLGDGLTVMLVDGMPMDRDGDELDLLVERLAGQRGPVRRVVLRGGGRAHADEATIQAAITAAKGASVVVSVGSGTLVDVGKVVAGQIGPVPHIVVQTAASVNGYADDQSVLVVDGVKRTVASDWPDVLIMDEQVLDCAPLALTRAGVGDTLPMYTAPADWKLAELVGHDYSYAPTLVELLHDQGAAIGDVAAAVGGRQPGGAARLAWMLAVGGIVMGAAGRTAPGSGMEHLVSHLLEMRAAADGTEDPWHGAKVGVATVLAALLWRRTLNRVSALSADELSFPSFEAMEARTRRAFAALDDSGDAATECWRVYRQKLERWHAQRPEMTSLLAGWPQVRGELEGLLAPPETIVETLRAAGAPTRFSELEPRIDGAAVRWALANCHLMRERFTVADLATFAGCWEEADVDSLLAEAATLGAGL